MLFSLQKIVLTAFLVLGVVSAGKGGKKSGRGEKIVALQVGSSDAITTLRDDNTEGLGDIFTWDRSNKIYKTDSIDDIGEHTLIGDNEGYCIRITNEGDNSQYSCTIQIYLEKGEITVVGPFNAGVTYASIVGGTQKYQGVSGQMKLSFAGELDGAFVYNYVLHIDYD